MAFAAIHDNSDSLSTSAQVVFSKTNSVVTSIRIYLVAVSENSNDSE